jgi:hypothetical protein
MLHGQPSSKGQTPKSWEAILGPAKSGERKDGLWGEERAADFVAFDRTSREKAAHGHVAYAVQEVSKRASKRAQNGTLCPGNERCTVERREEMNGWPF